MGRTVKEHLAHHHSRSGAFDLSVGTELEKLRKCFEALETNADSGDEMKKSFGAAKDSVDRLGALFNGHAQYHRDMGQDVEKSADIDDLGKLAPTQISAVYDPSKAPGSRLVPRTGQREFSSMPQVAEGFEGLVKCGDDRES